jgi:ASC-1-like (ASCH) protein
MKWKGKLIKYIVERLKDDTIWKNTIEKITIDPTIGVHLAVFNEPFLSLVFNGQKKIESRFSINKISPYGKVKKGDVIILKESGGFVTGIFVAGDVKFFDNLQQSVLEEIEIKFGEHICSACDKDFWKNRDRAKYASLIEVKKVKKLSPFKIGKNDRSGWSVVRAGVASSLFEKELSI